MRTIFVAALTLLGCYRSHDRGIDGGPPISGPSCCEEAATPGECLASRAQCMWLIPNGCGPAPDGFETHPSCVALSTCSSDGECGTGRQCVSYWVDPCAGGSCDACGGGEGHCAPQCHFDP